MSAAAESAINVNSIGGDVERFDGFGEKDWDMVSGISGVVG